MNELVLTADILGWALVKLVPTAVFRLFVGESVPAAEMFGSARVSSFLPPEF